jgi:hypothetical protein
MFSNIKVSDNVGVLGVINPDVKTAAAYSSGYVNAGVASQFLAVIMAGTLGSSATIDAKIQQATDSGGTGVKDVTGKAITQMTQAGTDQSDTQAVIAFSAQDLDLAGGFTHVRLTVTVGTATSDMGAVLLGVGGRDIPLADASTVGEVV